MVGLVVVFVLFTVSDVDFDEIVDDWSQKLNQLLRACETDTVVERGGNRL